MAMDNILVLQHIECEPLGIFEDVLRTNGFNFRYLRLYVDSYESVDIAQYGALIILGGPMNADEVDKYPFLGWEIDLIKKAQNSNLPILGICLGAQLIAKSNGAEIKKGTAREVGWHKVRLTEEGTSDSLFSGLDKEFNVFQLHSDMFKISKNALRLAYSVKCVNQAFRIKDNVYGLQFHLEVTKKMLKDWLKVYKNDLNRVDRENILGRLDDNLKRLNTAGKSFLKNFADKCYQKV